MRVLLVCLLVVYHSFAPFSGQWDAIPGAEKLPAYSLIAETTYSFFLEAFVFISGLLLGGRDSKKALRTESADFLLHKLKRLIIPSIIFSIIYFISFYSWKGVNHFSYTVLNGCGHLWFLPMLFWLFVGMWLLAKVNIHPYWLFAMAVGGVLLSNSAMPLRIGSAMYYFLFFILGFYAERGLVKKLFEPSARIIAGFAIGFFTTFITARHMPGPDSVTHIILGNGVRAVYAFCGMMFSWLIIVRCVPIDAKLPKWVITIANYSFGIYIMQQFILKWLYYFTPLPSAIDYILVPWIGVVVAIAISWLITHLLYQIKIGKYLF